MKSFENVLYIRRSEVDRFI